MDREKFDHVWLTEPTAENRELDKAEQTQLRAGVNSLSYLGLGIRVDILSALGSLARGQASGRLGVLPRGAI